MAGARPATDVISVGHVAHRRRCVVVAGTIRRSPTAPDTELAVAAGRGPQTRAGHGGLGYGWTSANSAGQVDIGSDLGKRLFAPVSS